MAHHLLPPPPPPPPGPAPRSVPATPHAPLLLGAAALTEPPPPGGAHFIGFAFAVAGIDLHVADLPVDGRCAAAGLFGFVAPPHWAGVGVRCHGTARHACPETDRTRGGDRTPSDDSPPDDLTTAGEALATFVVDRGGEVRAAMGRPGEEVFDPGPPAGLLVDAVHRALGLPSPGDAPPTTALVAGLWIDDLVELAAGGRVPTWAEAVARHPGAPGRGRTRVAASPETVAEATVRVLDGRDWSRLRAEAVDATFPAPDLEPAEAAWMDDTMFARWTLSPLPATRPSLALLRAVGGHELASGVEEVLRHLDLLDAPGPGEPGVTAG